jgi:hypothetical protein
MTGLVRKATLFAVCGLLVAGVAMAGTPDPSTSTIGTIIQLGDTTTIVQAAGGGFTENSATARSNKTVVVRDIANAFVAGATVRAYFGNCYGFEIRLANHQPSHPNPSGNPPGFDCATRVVTALTDVNGVATFRIIGSTNLVSGGAAGAPEGCCTITAQAPGGPEVTLGTNSVAVADLQGANGMNGVDFTFYLAVRFGGAGGYRPRCNYVGAAGTVDGQDTVAFLGYRWGDGTTGNYPICN